MINIIKKKIKGFGSLFKAHAYPMTGEQLDLTGMARETLLLAMADAPLCRPDCPGLCPQCGADLTTAPCGCQAQRTDERWAILDQLRGELD